MSTWCLLTAPEFWQGSPHATLKKRQMLLFQFNCKKKKKKRYYAALHLDACQSKLAMFLLGDTSALMALPSICDNWSRPRLECGLCYEGCSTSRCKLNALCCCWGTEQQCCGFVVVVVFFCSWVIAVALLHLRGEFRAEMTSEICWVC